MSSIFNVFIYDFYFIYLSLSAASPTSSMTEPNIQAYPTRGIANVALLVTHALE